jgi:hypothetical protein
VLPGVINACCGHGDPSQAYVVFSNGVFLQGFEVRQSISSVCEISQTDQTGERQ